MQKGSLNKALKTAFKVIFPIERLLKVLIDLIEALKTAFKGPPLERLLNSVSSVFLQGFLLYYEGGSFR